MAEMFRKSGAGSVTGHWNARTRKVGLILGRAVGVGKLNYCLELTTTGEFLGRASADDYRFCPHLAGTYKRLDCAPS